MVGLMVVLAVAILFPVFFGEPRQVKDQVGGDSWRNLIFDFQTLITGIAAVAAATLTILTMEETDRRADKRHQELIELQVRPDQLRIERALNPQLQELSHLLSELREIRSVKDLIAGSGDPNFQWMSRVALDHLPFFEKLETILGRSQFVAGSSLFDGQTASFLNRLEDSLTTLLPSLERHLKAINPLTHANDTFDYEENVFEYVFFDTQSAIFHALKALDDLVQALQRLSDQYKPSVPLIR